MWRVRVRVTDAAVTMPLTPLTRRALFVSLYVGATLLASAALVTIAVLAPAPPVALPMIVATCIALPMVAAWEMPRSVVVLRAAVASARGRRHVEQLRRELDRLPETRHPLGL
jgi:hypothetical protein